MMGLNRIIVRAFLILIAAFLLSGSIAAGQSGRRGTKPPPITNPTPEPTPGPSKPAKDSKPEFTLIVGIDRNSSIVDNAAYYSDTALRACLDRLDDSRAIKVEPAQRDLTRGEAVRRAKAETEAFVVLLQLRSESSSSNSDLVLEYWIFAPKTAEVRGSGRTYTGSTARRGGVIMGPTTGSRGNAMYMDALVREAGRQAAEDILKKLHVSAGDPIPH